MRGVLIRLAHSHQRHRSVLRGFPGASLRTGAAAAEWGHRGGARGHGRLAHLAWEPFFGAVPNASCVLEFKEGTVTLTAIATFPHPTLHPRNGPLPNSCPSTRSDRRGLWGKSP